MSSTSTRQHRTLEATVACVLAGVLAGCGGPSNDPANTTVTLDRAKEYLRSQFSRIEGELPSSAEYEQTLSHERDCYELSVTGKRSTGQVHVRADYTIRDMSAEQTSGLFAALRTWPKSGDYRVLDSDPDEQRLVLAHRERGTRIQLNVNGKETSYIGLTSACVWPDGTPTPAD